MLFTQTRVYCHETEMPGGSDIDYAIRAIAVAYYFDLEMPQAEIANRLPIHKNTLQSLIARVRSRSTSNQLPDVLQHIKNKLGRGRRALVAPGSAESFAIRDTVRDLKYHNLIEATNHAQNRKALKEINVNIPTLKGPQSRNVLRQQDHCIADSQDSRPIKRKRQIKKPGGYDLDKRLKYTYELEELIKDNVIVIVCDEKKWLFGGSGNTHVSMP